MSLRTPAPLPSRSSRSRRSPTSSPTRSRAGAAGPEPAARRVADDDRPAVRVVRRHAAGRVGADGRGVRSHRPAAAAGGRHARAGGSTRCSPSRRSLPLLFAARLVQGAADGVTWVVGLRAHRRSVRPRRARPRDGLRDVGHERRLHGRPVDRRLAVRDRRHRAAVRVRGGAGACLRGRVRSRSGRRRPPRTRRRRRSGPSMRTPAVAVCAASWSSSARRSRCSSRCCRCSSTGGSGCRRRRSAWCSASRPCVRRHAARLRSADRRWGSRRLIRLGLI